MNKLLAPVKNFLREEDAPTMVEYGLLVALIAVVCIAAVSLLGSNINTQLGNAAGSVSGS